MDIYNSLDDPAIVRRLAAGDIGVLPTDTVYGIVAQASHKSAVSRVYAAKQRENKPGTIIAASIDQLVGLGLKRRYLVPVADYWPGAVSVVIPCGQELAYILEGATGLAVRIPDHSGLQKLLSHTGPLLTSSANLTGRPTAATMQAAAEMLGDSVDFYIDGGDMSGKQPSTLIRIVDDAVEVLRQGAVVIN